MTVVVKSVNGIPFVRFVEEYIPKIKDKHIFYVVASNLEQDNRLSGKVIKIGRSLGTGKKRLSEYATYLGREAQTSTDQSGLRILYIKTFPKKQPLITGKSSLEIFESQLKLLLKEKYGNIPGRGDERFRVDVKELLDIIDEFKPDLSEARNDFVRRSERLGGEKLVWITIDENGKKFLEFHPQFKEIMDAYFKEQGFKRLKDKLGITDGMIQNTTELSEISQISNGIVYSRNTTYNADLGQEPSVNNYSFLNDSPLPTRNPRRDTIWEGEGQNEETGNEETGNEETGNALMNVFDSISPLSSPQEPGIMNTLMNVFSPLLSPLSSQEEQSRERPITAAQAFIQARRTGDIEFNNPFN